MTVAGLRVWASSCSHVAKDLERGRESLADAIRDSESAEGFGWDIAINLGDFSSSQVPPGDEEAEEILHQFKALESHRREEVYTVVGNHDASGPDEPTQWWFRKWIDPTGEQTEHSGVDRSCVPYPIEGTWERYAFQVGNVLFLLMGDRNDGGPPVGRGEYGGYPAGAVTGETFAWWRSMVEANQDKIIVSAHHHMLKETTVGSGPWEGYERDELGNWVSGIHGYFEDGGPEGASYLYFVDGQPDAQAFEGYLAEHPGAIDLWFGGHTHVDPDVVINGRSHIERKWDVNFVNVAALSKHHGTQRTAMSRLFIFTEGSDELIVRCYVHASDVVESGWLARAERKLPLRYAFSGGGES